MAQTDDRRYSKDRRAADLGPPAGSFERRWVSDRRHIFVEEIELSEADMATLFPLFASADDHSRPVSRAAAQISD